MTPLSKSMAQPIISPVNQDFKKENSYYIMYTFLFVILLQNENY